MRTRICDLPDIRSPVVRAGMGPFTSADLVVAASNAGALGSLGSSNRPVADLRAHLGVSASGPIVLSR